MKPTITIRFSSNTQSPGEAPTLEFHVLRTARKQYELDEALFSITGNVVFINFRLVRALAQKMNDARDLRRNPELTVYAGKLNLMGLIDEIYHYLVHLYETTTNPGVFQRALEFVRAQCGEREVSAFLREFSELYPSTAVFKGDLPAAKFLHGATAGRMNELIVLEEAIHTFFLNRNPALRNFRELYDDTKLEEGGRYHSLLDTLERFFRSEPKFGPNNDDIFSLFRAAATAHPDDLEAQLAFLRSLWGMLLPEEFLLRIARAGDLLREDQRATGFGGPGPTRVPRYGREDEYGLLELDEERFTPDSDWMPNVVLIAKNTYVWLDQLSKKYQRPITRLDQIPDEELDRLARWHFTGLWLIGVWERSRASQQIKQRMGNPEAVASAYSLYDYEIAHDLGGEEAFQNLRWRAWQRGVRLAGDMVPNHVGLFSRWVIEHPEYFIQSSYPPYPNYRFTGPDLSDHPGIELRIEDGYWSHADAAVVFQRVDRSNGQVSYLYHGNDGTNMPWNDTAQLNFLRNDVREAVIGMIFRVAGKCSIIRFDAAMVLAKKHFERLWFPEPGSGGAIPSRADYAIPKKEFDALFPQEFWREVVDRVNAELPNTLLLAEAFWLLEGYFVRTLGMHRVYNSAFMHMFMKEENAQYRELIRNTLHYNPEILKRYVNFMSNPDEKTAVEQFGKGDKYFGVATMMVTLPGLPMFGHGQLEGFGEKYGMEYRRAYHDEQADEQLIRRHEQELVPFIHKRYLFSQVSNFEMYDFTAGHGGVDENVFAFSNKTMSERALVFYHNKYAESDGWINLSCGKVRREGDETLRKVTVAEALSLHGDENCYYVFRDAVSGLEYLRSGRELCSRGFFLSLRAYERRVFLDIQEVRDHDGSIHRLAQHVGYHGVHDLWQIARRLRLHDCHQAFAGIVGELRHRREALWSGRSNAAEFASTTPVGQFVAQVDQILNCAIDQRAIGATMEGLLHNLRIALRARPARSTSASPRRKSGDSPTASGLLSLAEDARDGLLLLVWMCCRGMKPLSATELLHDLQIADAYRSALQQAGLHEGAENDALLIALLLEEETAAAETEGDFAVSLSALLEHPSARRFINLHAHEDVQYYHKESLLRLVQWRAMWTLVGAIAADPTRPAAPLAQELAAACKRVETLSGKTRYRFDELRASLHTADAPGRTTTTKGE